MKNETIHCNNKPSVKFQDGMKRGAKQRNILELQGCHLYPSKALVLFPTIWKAKGLEKQLSPHLRSSANPSYHSLLRSQKPCQKRKWPYWCWVSFFFLQESDLWHTSLPGCIDRLALFLQDRTMTEQSPLCTSLISQDHWSQVISSFRETTTTVSYATRNVEILEESDSRRLHLFLLIIMCTISFTVLPSTTIYRQWWAIGRAS